MCPYAKWDFEKFKVPICEPCNDFCTFCIEGNCNRLKEIEAKINKDKYFGSKETITRR